MERIAIIGTGIAGLGCAHFLQHRYQLTLYEKSDYVGGHSHTLSVDAEHGPVAIDTGFMTYNEVTYPNLTPSVSRTRRGLASQLDVVQRAAPAGASSSSAVRA